MGAKTERWLFRGLGFIVGCLIVWGVSSYSEYVRETKCNEALVAMQSFEVCYEKLPGCFVDFEDVHLVGKAIDFKKRECTE